MNRALRGGPLVLLPLLAACDGPVVTGLRARQENFVVTLEIDVEDRDGDLDGGAVDVVWDGVSIQRPIGGGVDRIDGTLYFDQPVSPCRVGEVVPLEVVVSDARGHESRTHRRTFEIEDGDVHQEREPNDTVEDARIQNAVDLAPGVAICGNLESSGLDGIYYDGDYDYYHVTVLESAEVVITLRALHPYAEIDLWEIEEDGRETPHYATSEVVMFTREVDVGATFFLFVAAGTGPHGDYGITFDWR